MFQYKSAWFSSSVPQSCRNFWISEGGTFAACRKADYLFSADATCPDTLRVFESKDYLWNKVTFFHSLFLSACEKRQSVKSVFMGHYVLPPASVQDEVRNLFGRLIWEREDEQLVTQTNDECSEEEISSSSSEPFNIDTPGDEDPMCCESQDYPASNMLSGYVSMSNLQKYSGDLSDFHPRCFQCSNCKAHCCLTLT